MRALRLNSEGPHCDLTVRRLTCVSRGGKYMVEEDRLTQVFTMLVERLSNVEASVGELSQSFVCSQAWRTFGVKPMSVTGLAWPVIYCRPATRTSSPNDEAGVHYSIFIRLACSRPILENRLRLQEDHLGYLRKRGDFDVDFLEKMSLEALHKAPTGAISDEWPTAVEYDPAPCVLLQLLLNREVRRSYPAVCKRHRVEWCLPSTEASCLYLGMSMSPQDAISPQKAVEMCFDSASRLTQELGLELDVEYAAVGPLPYAAEVMKWALPEYGGAMRQSCCHNPVEKLRLGRAMTRQFGETVGCGHYVENVCVMEPKECRLV